MLYIFKRPFLEAVWEMDFGIKGNGGIKVSLKIIPEVHLSDGNRW